MSRDSSLDIVQKRFLNSQVLITGGLGFIGSHLARRLIDLGASVAIIDNMLEGHGANLFNLNKYQDKVLVISADVSEGKQLEHLKQRFDYIFHLAAQTGHASSISAPILDLKHNVISTLNVLEFCRRYSNDAHIVFTSTRQVYGTPRYLPVDEQHVIAPPDANGISKYAAEEYLRLYGRVHGVSGTCLRLTNTYGPGMRISDARQMFLGIWIRRAIEKVPFDIYGDGLQRRDFNYIDDVADAIILAADRQLSGQCFNLGSEEIVSLIDLASILVEVTGSNAVWRLVPFPAERKAIDIGHYRGDYRKFASATGWKPDVQLRDGLTKTVQYYQRNWHEYV